MNLVVKVISVVIILIGILYIYVAAVALLNVDVISKQMLENSLALVPYQFLPELKEDLVKNDIYILLFGIVCLAVGIFLLYKTKKKTNIEKAETQP